MVRDEEGEGGGGGPIIAQRVLRAMEGSMYHLKSALNLLTQIRERRSFLKNCSLAKEVGRYPEISFCISMDPF
jgi:hypothetical protein